MTTIWNNEKFLEARQSREMAQTVAAGYLDITPEYLSMLENGRKQPSQALILKMVKLYSKPITFFLQNDKSKLST
jgi:transcriptional regulator with XRE-family HTH domain